MRENTFFDSSVHETLSLDEISRIGAQAMLKTALVAEVEAYLSSVMFARNI